MYGEIKSNLGRLITRLRYSDETNASTPTDEINPETWHHEAEPGLGERLKRKRRWLTLYGMLAAGILLVLSQWAGQLMLAVATHPLVWRSAVVLGLFGFGYYQGAKWQRSKLEQWDWWVGMLPDGPEVWLGEYETADDGTSVFVPYRGFDWLGFRSRQLRLGELGESVAHHHAKRGRDMDSPARVRLDDAITRKQGTAFGDVVTTLTSSIEPDQFGQHSDAYAAPPDLADKAMYSNLKDDYEQYVEDIVPSLQADISALQQRVGDLRAQLAETEDEKVEKIIERQTRLLEATHRPHDRDRQRAATGNEETGATGDVPAFVQNGGDDS